MPDVRVLRSSLAAFAVEVGRPLAPWQAAALDLEVRTTVIVAPRQSGKSRSLAVLALWRAFRDAGHRVLVVSAGEEASRRLLAEVRAVAVASPLLRESVLDEAAALLSLTNGSEVRSVPASERQVRGWTVDTLLVDEAAMVPDDLLLGAALPTTAARPDARVVLASSALSAAGAFYDHAIRGEGGSEHVRTFRWSLGDAEWISPSVVAAAREALSPLRFAAEYEGVFASGADALFSRQALDRVLAPYAPWPLAALRGPASVFAGVDWGAVNDRSALVAVGRLAGERRFGVVCAHRWPAGAPLPRVIGDVVGSQAHFDLLAAETNGLGLPLTQELFRRLQERASSLGGGVKRSGAVMVDARDFERSMALRRRFPAAGAARPRGLVTRAVAVHTTAELKATVYSALRLLVDEGRLVIPADAENLVRELLLLRVDLSPTGLERVEASSGHDDLADALAFSLGPRRGRDGQWRCELAALADRRVELPSPTLPAGVALERLECVALPGGLEVPVTPVWQSVRGRSVTVPDPLRLGPRAPATPAEHRIAVGRAAVQAVLSQPTVTTTKESP